MYPNPANPLNAENMVRLWDLSGMQPNPYLTIEHFQALLYYKIYMGVQKKYSDIKRAFAMKGGWEGWLPVELGLWLMEAGFEVEREQQVFKIAKQAADMVVAHRAFAGIRMIVELKCEGLFQDVLKSQGEPDESRQNLALPPAFATRITKDIEKFGNAAGSNLLDEYTGTYFCCIGISLMKISRDYLVDNPQNTPYLERGAEKLAETAYQLGMIAATERGLVNDVQGEDLLIWWSTVYQKA